MMTSIPVGDTLRPGQFSTAGRRVSAAAALGNVSAYDPATGELTWRTEIDGGPSAGTLATAGNLVFTAARLGTFFALDARSGELLWEFHTGASVGASQITYPGERHAVRVGGRRQRDRHVRAPRPLRTARRSRGSITPGGFTRWCQQWRVIFYAEAVAGSAPDPAGEFPAGRKPAMSSTTNERNAARRAAVAAGCLVAAVCSIRRRAGRVRAAGPR